MGLRTEKGTKVADNLLHISSHRALNNIHTECWSVLGWTTRKRCFSVFVLFWLRHAYVRKIPGSPRDTYSRSGRAWERSYVPAVLNSRFHVCSSLAPRPMTVVFGLGTRLRVRMRTTYKMASYATDRSQPVLWTTPSTKVNSELWRRWVIVLLRVVISISFVIKWRWVLEPFSSYRCLNKVVVTKKKKEWETEWHFCNRTLSRLAVFRVAVGHLYESCWS